MSNWIITHTAYRICPECHQKLIIDLNNAKIFHNYEVWNYAVELYQINRNGPYNAVANCCLCDTTSDRLINWGVSRFGYAFCPKCMMRWKSYLTDYDMYIIPGGILYAIFGIYELEHKKGIDRLRQGTLSNYVGRDLIDLAAFYIMAKEEEIKDVHLSLISELSSLLAGEKCR